MSNDDILNELKKTNKLLILAYADKIENQLEKVASSKERKTIWVLLNGTNDNKELSKITKLSIRGIQNILKEYEDCELINNPRGKPATRKIDYVPPSWIELLPKEQEEETSE